MTIGFNDVGNTRRSVGVAPAFNKAYGRYYGTIQSRIDAGTYDPMADWQNVNWNLISQRSTDIGNNRVYANTLEKKNQRGDRNDYNTEIKQNEAEYQNLISADYIKNAANRLYSDKGYSSPEIDYLNRLTGATKNGLNASPIYTF